MHRQLLFNVVGGRPWQRSPGGSAVTSATASIETGLVGSSIVALGILIDRYAPKAPSVFMALTVGIGFMALSVPPNNQMLFYLACGVMGAGRGVSGFRLWRFFGGDCG